MAAFLHRALAATLPPPICRTQTAIPVDECATLADLYDDTHGTSWTDHTGWLVNPNPCTWQGVTCSAGHVTGLDLQNNHINGPLPDSIGSLTSLTNLYLNGNQLTGPIPPQVKDLSQLMYLILGNNELTGPIPAGLSTLPHLRSLVLHGNPLGGRIPAEFGNLPSLVYLGLTAAEFTGPIPAELGNIATLESLYLNSNHLSGPVPDSLRTGTAITTLALYAQDGCLTAAAPQPTNWLSTLDPDWNDGCNPVEPLVIPVIWVRSGQVGDPYSSSLSATGGVPPYTWRITSGALPAGLTFHPDGTIVGTPTHHATVSPTYEVEDSVGTVVSKQVGISIFVYPELCGTQTSIPELECVTLSFDVFDPTGGPFWTNSTGWLTNPDPCTWWGITCAAGHVDELDLHVNNLVGSIPPNLSNLTALRVAYLYSNHLTGPIPAELGTLTSLQELYLDSNALTGSIPTSFDGLSALTRLELQNNQLSGPISDGLRTGTAPLTNLRLYGQTGCLTTPLSATAEWLHLMDPNWNDGCNPAPLVITTASLPTGDVGNPYTATLAATGGVTPYTWTITAGTLPTGLTLNTDGTITGTPTHHTTTNLTVTATDGDNSHDTGILGLTITITPALCGTQTTIPEIECAALADLYNDTNGPSWTDHTGWLTNPDPCTWHGITCAAGHVDRLDLFPNNLDGALPPTLGNLTALRLAFLHSNHLTGPIPVELGTLTSLEDLTLHSNALTGSIPTSFDGLSALSWMDLHDNQLSGPISDGLRTGTAPLIWLQLHGQTGCLTTSLQATTEWLNSMDSNWNDGC